MVEISRRLYHNPLALKWFVNSIEVGKTPAEILNNKEDLLSFCLSNVYEKLSEEARKVLSVLLASKKTLNDAEIIFLSDLSPLLFRKAINELFTTTLINREIHSTGDIEEIKYSLSDFAKEYLLKHHTVSANLVREINNRARSLAQSLQDIKLQTEHNEFGLNSLTIRNTNEKVVSKLIVEALKISRKEDYTPALQKLEEAKSILPDYFEIYRVSAFIKAQQEDLLGAENDYALALEIEPENARLHFYYAQFLLFQMEDFERAYEHCLKVYDLRPIHPYTSLLLSRYYNAVNDFENARETLEKYILHEQDLNSRNWRIAQTDLIQVYHRWANAKCTIDIDYPAAEALYSHSFKLFEEAIEKRNFDFKLVKNFSQSMYSFISYIPKIHDHNDHNVNLLSSLITKYNDYLKMTSFYSSILQKFNQVYKVDLATLDTSVLEDKYKGIVTKFFLNTPYVFIESANGRYFAHRDEFMNISNWSEVYDGAGVHFDLGKNSQGECAINIILSPTVEVGT